MLFNSKEKAYTPFYTHLWRVIKPIKWSILCFIILMYTCQYMGSRELINQLGNVLIIFLCLAVVAKIKVFNILFAVLISILISLELTCLLVMGERVSVTVLSASIDTDLSIASGTTMPVFLKAIPWIIFFSIIFSSLVLEIKKFKLKTYLPLVIVFIAVMTSITYYQLEAYKIYLVEWGGYTKYDYSNKPLFFKKTLYHQSYPLIAGDLYYIGAEFYELYEAKKLANHDTWPEGITFSKTKKTPLKVIIVIGESSTVTHYSLYGYPYKTTPRLDEYYKNKEITKIDKVISGAALTRDSLKLTLSFATAHEPRRFFEYMNLVDMAKKAHYKTVWISSTYESGPYTGYVASIERSSDKYFNNRNNGTLENKDDLSIPIVLDKEYKKGEKQFFILHMLGSHIPYEVRYDEQDKYLTTMAKTTHYDRSIHHTDRMLDELIKLIKKYDEDTLLYYFPDHGDLATKGHGLVFGDVVDQYKIPMIIYQHKNKLDIVPLLNKYRTKTGILNIINSHYIISELLGYEVDEKTIKQAKVDGEYIYHPNGQIYKFDEIEKNGVLKPGN